MQIQNAIKYCTEKTLSHYENFPVGSLLLPKKLRMPVYVIYTFAREADDIADEIKDKSKARVLLQEYREKLNLSVQGKPDNDPIFIALTHVLENFPISADYLQQLLDAFEQDLNVSEYESWDEVLSYCENSANPIGRILLQLMGYHHEENLQLSDSICSGLQLINFWQDLSIDLPGGRNYIPQELWRNFDLDFNRSNVSEMNDRYSGLSAALINYTRALYDAGKNLASVLPGRAGMEIGVIYAGGNAILNRLKEMGPAIFVDRPALKKYDWIKVFARGIFNV